MELNNSLTKNNLKFLLQLIQITEPDDSDCSSCLSRLAQFADSQGHGLAKNNSLEFVEHHLRQCPCCEDEFESLLVAIATLH